MSVLAVGPIAVAAHTNTTSYVYAGTDGGGVFSLHSSAAVDPPVFATFENPLPGPVAGVATIHGWAFATEQDIAIAEVELFVDGERMSDIPCCSERLDVQTAFPEFPAANTLASGWGMVFNWGILTPGAHTIQVRITTANDNHFFSEVRAVTVIKPGEFEFLDAFGVAGATASIEDEDLVLAGVVVRDVLTQEEKQINTRFAWIEGVQSFGLVEAETVAVVAQASVFESFWKTLTAGLRLFPDTLAWAAPGVTAFSDNPDNEQVVAGATVINGWAFADEAGASLSEVVLNIDQDMQNNMQDNMQAMHHHIPCCSERVDVQDTFPDNLNALRSGWGITFNYGVLGAGPHQIDVNITSSDGASVVLTRSIHVVSLGGAEFVEQFSLAGATTRVEGEEVLIEGVTGRDKVTGQMLNLDLRLRWFRNTQALGIVSALLSASN